MNTLIQCGIVIICQLTICSFAGFAFVFFEFPLTRVLFTIILATMMIPGDVVIITNYIQIQHWKLSICYAHRWSLEKYHSVHGCLPDEIRAVGGGAQSEVWMQMLADIIHIPVRVPDHPRYVGTMGSCYCAMVGLGLLKDYSSVEAHAKAGRLFTPIDEHKAVYDRQFNLYKALYPALKPLYVQANGWY